MTRERPWGDALSPQQALEEINVITSYSIHYTKLYENRAAESDGARHVPGTSALVAPAAATDYLRWNPISEAQDVPEPFPPPFRPARGRRIRIGDLASYNFV